MNDNKKRLKVGEKTTILVALIVFISTCSKMIMKLGQPTATMQDKVIVPVLIGALGVLLYNLIKVAKSKQSKYKKYLSK